jgi:hypothetical protein
MIAIEGLDMIDTSACTIDQDMMRHWYFVSPPIIKDLQRLLRDGFTPGQRGLPVPVPPDFLWRLLVAVMRCRDVSTVFTLVQFPAIVRVASDRRALPSATMVASKPKDAAKRVWREHRGHAKRLTHAAPGTPRAIRAGVGGPGFDRVRRVSSAAPLTPWSSRRTNAA